MRKNSETERCQRFVQLLKNSGKILKIQLDKLLSTTQQHQSTDWQYKQKLV